MKTYWASAPAAWDAVTVRNLLNHSSGIPNLTSLDDFETFKVLPATLEELIGRVAGLPLEMQPGAEWSYSNSNYILLTAVLEAVSEQPCATFVEENLLAPLDMRDTGLDTSAEIIPNRAAGYSLTGGGVVNAESIDMSITRGAGQLYSTTRDLLKWQRGLFGGQVLSPESLAAYTTPYKGDYALGVVVEDTDRGRTLWHSGGIEGFNAWLGHDPDRGVTVAVLANLEVPGPSSERAATRLGRALMRIARDG